jgi:predicted nucleotidyltransferase
MRIYNPNLNPDIWEADESQIKSDLRIKLLQIANDFYASTKLTVPIKDVILLGSNANYNWTPTSDLDVHVVIDFKQLNMSDKDAKEYTNLLKYKWNSEHDIHIKTYNVEVYIQNSTEKNSATGVYSLLNDNWIIKPVKENVVLDKPLIVKKYSDMVKRIDSAIQEQNIESMKSVIKDIYDFRQAGLDRAGEFSTENIVFKLLRNKNYMEKLKDAVNKIYDKTVSLN